MPSPSWSAGASSTTPTPPGSVISPFSISSASPGPPSDRVRVSTASPLSLPSNPVASSQAPETIFQYWAGDATFAGKVIVTVTGLPRTKLLIVKSKKPYGNATPAGLPAAGRLLSATATSLVKTPPLVENRTGPAPVADGTPETVLTRG